VRKFDPFVPMGFAAGVQAFKDAGLSVTEENTARIASRWVRASAAEHDRREHGEVARVQVAAQDLAVLIPGSIINAAAGQLSIKFGIRGPNLALVTACTTSTHSVGIAARTIQYGDADVMIAGGSESAFTPLGLGSFAQARALSLRNDEPARASRPWDRDRDGFVMSEGGGAVVLEEYEHARARGATIYAEFAGFGMSGDAYHNHRTAEDGEGARLAMVNAVRDAGLDPSQVQYINRARDVDGTR